MPKADRAGAPWNRQKDESEQAYAAFLIYRDMGANRSTEKVRQECGKNKRLIERWSSRWKWVERCRAWDNQLQEAAYAQAVKRVREMSNRHTKTALKMQVEAVEALKRMDPKDINPKNIVAFIREGTNLERESRKILICMTDRNQEEKDSRSLAEIISEAWEKRQQGE